MSHERHGSLHLRVKNQRERELKIVKEWNVKLDRQTGDRQTVRQTNKQLDGLPEWKIHNTDFIMMNENSTGIFTLQTVRQIRRQMGR